MKARESSDAIIIRQMERIGELTASISRAQDELTDCQKDRDSWIASARTLRAENERLREALLNVEHQLATDSDLDDAVTRPDKYDTLLDIVRAALGKAGV